MIKPKKPFSLYKRPTAKKGIFIYYVQFRNEHGDYMTAIASPLPNRLHILFLGS